MKLCVVSRYPPELNGIGEYAWSIVHGLASTDRFSAITVLSQRPDPRAAVPFATTHPNADDHSVVRTNQLWSRDEPLAAPRRVQAIRVDQPDAIWLHLD